MTVIDSNEYSARISRNKNAQPKCASCMNHIWATTLFGQARFAPARFAEHQVKTAWRRNYLFRSGVVGKMPFGVFFRSSLAHSCLMLGNSWLKCESQFHTSRLRERTIKCRFQGHVPPTSGEASGLTQVSKQPKCPEVLKESAKSDWRLRAESLKRVSRVVGETAKSSSSLSASDRFGTVNQEARKKFGSRHDWTTRGPCNGNAWKKYRVVPRARAPRAPFFMLILVGLP